MSLADAHRAFDGAVAEMARAGALFRGALTAARRDLLLARLNAAAAALAEARRGVAMARLDPDPLPQHARPAPAPTNIRRLHCRP